MRNRVISIEEFEYETMMGSTQDSIVWGLGVVEWKSVFMLTPGQYISSSPFNPMPTDNSLYLQPRWEMTVDVDNDLYKKALEDEIREALTDGKSFWDINSNTVCPLPYGANISVKIDDVNNVRIAGWGSSQNGSYRSEISMSLEHLTTILNNGPNGTSGSSNNQSVIIRNNPEYGIDLQDKSIDFNYYSRKARKISGFLNTMHLPLSLAKKRMYLYRNIPSPGGTTRVFPLEKRYPQWAGKYGGKLIAPRLGTIGVDMTNSSIIRTSNILKMGGKLVAIGGLALGAKDIYDNGLSFSNGLHTGMAVIAILPGGQGIAGVYFLIDAGVTIFTGQGIGEHIDGWIDQDNNEKNVIYENSSHIFVDSPIKLPNLPLDRNNLIGNINLNTF